MSEPASGSLSLTLSRGITLLEYVCAAETAPTIGQVASSTGRASRSAAYRFAARTPEAHYLVRVEIGAVQNPSGSGVWKPTRPAGSKARRKPSGRP